MAIVAAAYVLSIAHKFDTGCQGEVENSFNPSMCVSVRVAE